MKSSLRLDLLVVVLAVLALRIPFLNQAIQGDDFYYLKGAEHALVVPLHPNHAKYVFQGDLVDMRGHPHPPLNAWVLAGLLAVFGEVREAPFHAAYIFFSLVAALSVLALARRYSPAPAAAALLFTVTPAFVINGTSLEADLPFVSFFLAALAFGVYQRYLLSALAAALAALAAYQAVVLAPILLLLLGWRKKGAWFAALAAPAAVAGYQAFERLTSGALPAAVLAGYMTTYNLQALGVKLRNAVALTGHAGWLVFPGLAAWAFRRQWIAGAAAGLAAAIYDPHPLFWASAGCGVMMLAECAAGWREPLCQWVLLFFAAALAIFFAGSARYLLPIAAAAALLVSQRVASRWLYAGVAAGAVAPLLLATVNYQHGEGYRRISYQAPRVFTNAEWGLRHYLELQGARPVEKGQVFWDGDAVVTSEYAAPVRTAGLGTAQVTEIQSGIPLRIVGLGSRSGYSSVAYGLRPFDISRAPLDRVEVALVSERAPELSRLTIGQPEAAAQIVSGVYNNDRWTSAKAIVRLKRPAGAKTLEAELFLPPQAPGRTVKLSAAGVELASKTFDQPGLHRIAVAAPPGDAVTVTLEVDRTFAVPPDERRLGFLLIAIGFR